MKKIALIASVSLLAWACNSPSSSENNQDEATSSENEMVFGEDFEVTDPMPSTKVLAMADLSPDQEVVLEAKVEAVCQKSGCWMDVPLSEDADMKVTFKDYGFFVPKDMAGETVYVKGNVKMDTMSVDYLRHMAEDAGKDSTEIASITEPEVQLTMVATGVRRAK